MYTETPIQGSLFFGMVPIIVTENFQDSVVGTVPPEFNDAQEFREWINEHYDTLKLQPLRRDSGKFLHGDVTESITDWVSDRGLLYTFVPTSLQNFSKIAIILAGMVLYNTIRK